MCDSQYYTLYHDYCEVGKNTTLGASLESLHVEFESMTHANGSFANAWIIRSMARCNVFCICESGNAIAIGWSTVVMLADGDITSRR